MRTGMVITGIGIILYTVGCSSKPVEEVKTAQSIEDRMEKSPENSIITGIGAVESRKDLEKYVNQVINSVKELNKEGQHYDALKIVTIDLSEDLDQLGNKEKSDEIEKYLRENYSSGMGQAKIYMQRVVGNKDHSNAHSLFRTIKEINRIAIKLGLSKQIVDTKQKEIQQIYSQLKNKT